LEDVLQRIHSVINNHLLPIQNPTRRAKAQRRRESKIQNYQDPVLLIEGAGGLLAPLGEGFNLLDVIAAMPPAFEDHGSWIKDQRPSIELRAASIQTIVVARNQLGTINHTLLTVQALRSRLQGFRGATNSVVLMNPARPDLSSHSNPQILNELLPTVSMFSLPYLPALAASLSKGGGKSALNRSAKRVSKTLEQLLDCPTLPWPERTSVS
jgi:dethiobiotin synthetase